jgi:hypothetical protein
LNDLRLGSRPYGPNAFTPSFTGPLYPKSIHGSPFALIEFQMATRIILLMSSDSKKKELRLHEFNSDRRYI